MAFRFTGFIHFTDGLLVRLVAICEKSTKNSFLASNCTSELADKQKITENVFIP